MKGLIDPLSYIYPPFLLSCRAFLKGILHGLLFSFYFDGGQLKEAGIGLPIVMVVLIKNCYS